jgi:competence protein ComEC
VAGVGKGNEYGHPGSETLALLARSEIPPLRTDRDGTIVVESDGRRWRVEGRQIAARGPPAENGRTTTGAEVMPTGRRINVNTATQAELEALPGVGPVIARRIIEGRPIGRWTTWRGSRGSDRSGWKRSGLWSP